MAYQRQNQNKKRKPQSKAAKAAAGENRDGVLRRYTQDGRLERKEDADSERSFTLSFSSEEPYTRWFGEEILSHSEGSVDLTRLNSIGVVLYNHDRDKVLGKITRAWVEDGRGLAEIEFDTDADAEVIRQKVSGGTLKGVSVGYRVDVWEEVAAGKKSSDGRFTGPCDVATRWTPYEISIVSVPADATVGVGRSADDAPEGTEDKGVSGFYFAEKQLQINRNLLKRRK